MLTLKLLVFSYSDLTPEKYRDAKPDPHRELEILERVDEKVKEKLMALLEAKVESQKSLFQKQAEDRRKVMARKQETRRLKLKEKYKRNIALDNAKTIHRLQYIVREKDKELHAVKNKNKYPTPLRLSAEAEHNWRMDLRRQIEDKTVKDQRSIRERGRHISKVKETQFQAQELKREKYYKKNNEDLDLALEKLRAEYMRPQEQQRTDYLRWHNDTVKKAKDDIVRQYTLSDSAKDKHGEDEAFPKTLQTGGYSNTPFQLTEKIPAISDSVEIKGASLRQKVRKTVLTKGYSTRMGVEIHNEGIAISCSGRSNENENESDSVGGSGKESSLYHDPKVGGIDFIPWGVNARKFLHSIVCGEIPLHHILDGIGSFSQDGLQGGQIKCMVCDMRVDNEIAIIQRAEAFKETTNKKSKEITKLEMKVSEHEKRVKVAIDKEKRYVLYVKKAAEQLVIDQRNLSVRRSPISFADIF